MGVLKNNVSFDLIFHTTGGQIQKLNNKNLYELR